CVAGRGDRARPDRAPVASGRTSGLLHAVRGVGRRCGSAHLPHGSATQPARARSRVTRRGRRAYRARHSDGRETTQPPRRIGAEDAVPTWSRIRTRPYGGRRWDDAVCGPSTFGGAITERVVASDTPRCQPCPAGTKAAFGTVCESFS